jgi:hypothetical protein
MGHTERSSLGASITVERSLVTAGLRPIYFLRLVSRTVAYFSSTALTRLDPNCPELECRGTCGHAERSIDRLDEVTLFSKNETFDLRHVEVLQGLRVGFQPCPMGFVSGMGEACASFDSNTSVSIKL